MASPKVVFVLGRPDMAQRMTVKEGAPSGQSWDRMMAAAQAGNADAYRSLLAEVASWLRRYYARRLPPAMTEDGTGRSAGYPPEAPHL